MRRSLRYCFIPLCLLLVQCQEQGRIEIHLSSSPLLEEDPLDPGLVTHVRMSITGPGMTPLETVSKYIPGGSAKITEIPFGSNRVITVEGLNGERGYPMSRGRSLPLEIGEEHQKITLLISRIGSFSFAPAYGLEVPRFGFGTAISPDGSLIIAGGAGGGIFDEPGNLLKSTERFDPVSGSTTTLKCAGMPCLTEPRAFGAALQIDEGLLLVSGIGQDGLLDTAVLFDTQLEMVETYQGTVLPRAYASATTLKKIGIVAGGLDASNNPVDDIEIFVPDKNKRLTKLPEARFGMASASTRSAGIFFGGMNGAGATSNELVVVNPTTSVVTTVTSQVESRVHAIALSLSDDRVLFIGGLTDDGNASTSIDLYDASVPALCKVGELGYGRWHTAATRLLDGRVLVTGGLTGRLPGAAPTASSAIVDARYIKIDQACTRPPDSRIAQSISPARIRRYLASATLLENGIVAINGGLDENNFLVLKSEVFVPDE